MSFRRSCEVIVAVVALWVAASEFIALFSLLAHWSQDTSLRAFWTSRDTIDMVEGTARDSGTTAAIFGIMAVIFERRQRLAALSPRRVGYWGAIAGVVTMAATELPLHLGANPGDGRWTDLASILLTAGFAGAWFGRGTLGLARWQASRAKRKQSAVGAPVI